MDHPIEPGLLRIFRYFTGVAMIYFALLWAYAVISTGWVWSTQVQLWGNFAVYLGVFGYLSWSRLEKRLKHLYLPLGLMIVTIFPVMSNFIYLLDPSQGDINNIISRSWLWLPVLFVPLVLIAWQYSFRAVLAFTIFTNGLELLVLLVVVQSINFQTITMLGVPFIRAFAFGIVGYIVRNLIETQRIQRRKLILANVRLGQYASTLEQLATSRERNRLATELHDTLAHTLSGLAVNLEAIKTILDPAQTEPQKMLDHSLHITRVGLDETRRALKALRAGPLADLGLCLALDGLVKSAADRAGLPIELSCPEDIPTLPIDVEQCIYRITQEALENIVRHANAAHAHVQLVITSSQVELTIRDDGSGFDATRPAPEDRYGLRGLRERASAVGAVLDVSSKPGSGTTIHFVWEQFNDQSADL